MVAGQRAGGCLGFHGCSMEGVETIANHPKSPLCEPSRASLRVPESDLRQISRRSGLMWHSR